METRRIFLHVGCPKTGTTYLQSTLWRSRDALRSQGVELPRDRASHVHLALAVRQRLAPAMDPPRALRVLDRMAAALARSTAPTIVISNELLVGATAGQAAGLHRLIGEAVGDIDVHLVITARDLSRQVPAAWQQRIQQRHTVEFARFLGSLREGTSYSGSFLQAHDASDVARRWGADLPPERVHIVTVPPPPAPPRLLLERFCGVIGIDPADVSDAAAVPNSSLGQTSIEVLRRVNLALGDRLPHSRAGYGRVGKRYLASEILAPLGGDRPTLPPEMEPWCRDRTEQLIGAIQIAGYDVVGDLDELRPDSERTSTPIADISDSEIATVAVGALADLLDQRNRDLEMIDSLRKQVRALPEPKPRDRNRTAVRRMIPRRVRAVLRRVRVKR